jgi:AMP phosphorylase
MKLRVKDMDIATGGVQVVILNQEDAKLFDLHHMDRVRVKKGRKSSIAVLDIAESSKAVPRGWIGFFEEVLSSLGVKHGDFVNFSLENKPESLSFIRKKLDGYELSSDELHSIVKDIVDDKLTSIELTSFVVANYANGMSDRETVAMTKSIANTGSRLLVEQHAECPIVDLHSIGGVPGNRTTMIVVPIVVAAGLMFPKTSSRAITSPAGTADTMEVLCSVTLPLKKLRSLLSKVGGFIVWGGAMNLAPADDKIIRVEYPLQIDAEGQMLASIMAKKASVSATHVLIEIPIGEGTKVKDFRHARHLKRRFEDLGKELGMCVLVRIFKGSEPVGNGIGPALEARDVLWVLQLHKNAPRDLRRKSVELAGELLEFCGCVKRGKGKKKASEILDSGRAYEKMKDIIRAQGGSVLSAEQVSLGKFSLDVRSAKPGVVKHIDNIHIAKIARLAGAPSDKGAGIFLHKHVDDRVKKGDLLLTIYAQSKHKLSYALDLWRKRNGMVII